MIANETIFHQRTNEVEVGNNKSLCGKFNFNNKQ